MRSDPGYWRKRRRTRVALRDLSPTTPGRTVGRPPVRPPARRLFAAVPGNRLDSPNTKARVGRPMILKLNHSTSFFSNSGTQPAIGISPRLTSVRNARRTDTRCFFSTCSTP
jgi:hypothetical protein